MALSASLGRNHKIKDTWCDPARLVTGLEGRVNVFLFIPVEASSMRTPFREEALNYIYRAALDLSDGRLKSATVLAHDYPDEEASLVLSLNLVVDGDWDTVRVLEKQIDALITEKSKSWTESEWDDFCRNIHLYMVPTAL